MNFHVLADKSEFIEENIKCFILHPDTITRFFSKVMVLPFPGVKMIKVDLR